MDNEEESGRPAAAGREMLRNRPQYNMQQQWQRRPIVHGQQRQRGNEDQEKVVPIICVLSSCPFDSFKDLIFYSDTLEKLVLGF